RAAARGDHWRGRGPHPGERLEDGVFSQTRSRAVRRLAHELELLHAGPLGADQARLAVADGAADDRVSLVRRDDLQLAGLAADDLCGGHGAEEIAVDEVARAAETHFLAERAEEPEGAPRPAAL